MKNVWLLSLLFLTSALYSGDPKRCGLSCLLDNPVQSKSVYTRFEALRDFQVEAKANKILDALFLVDTTINILKNNLSKIGSLTKTAGKREIGTLDGVRQVVAITRKIEEWKRLRDTLMKDLETIVK